MVACPVSETVVPLAGRFFQQIWRLRGLEDLDPHAGARMATALGLTGTSATVTPAMMVAMPANALGVTVSSRNMRPMASATMGMTSVLRLTIVASILLI